MMKIVLPTIGVALIFLFQPDARAQISDEALLEIIRDRKEQIRVTSLPFRMDPATSSLCRLPNLGPVANGNSAQPHAFAGFSIFSNELGNAPLWDVFEKFPEGAVIVKEKSRVDDDSTELFTGMLKRESGYSAHGGDWEYFTVDGLAKEVKSRGRLRECMECHQQYEAFDFVTKVYSARLGREKSVTTKMMSQGQWIDADSIVRCGTSQTIFLPASRAETFGSQLSRTAAIAKWQESNRVGKEPPDDLESVGGPKLFYETNPKKNTLGYWVLQDDYARWEFDVAEPGTYKVRVLQGCGKGSGGAEVSLQIAAEELRMIVEDTGHFQNFIWKDVGSVTFAKPGTYTLTVKARSKPGVAVMDLRQIRLVKTLESAPSK